MLTKISKNIVKILRIFPYPVKRTLFLWTRPLRKVLFWGKTHYCVICESYFRKFMTCFGVHLTPNACCPICGSTPRDRAAWLFLQHKTNLFDQLPQKMLHVAPELCLEAKFRRVTKLDYLTADLANRRAMIKMDIADIQYPDGSFDVIYCSHVLEHVENDRQAMHEFNRVLKPGGYAVLQVPITVQATFEDPSVKAPADRQRLFGLPDHVRRYGPDVKERLEEAGFTVTVTSAMDILNTSDHIRLGMPKDNHVIFFCEK